jgi:anthranilate phosphoribosyltransferase
MPELHSSNSEHRASNIERTQGIRALLRDLGQGPHAGRSLSREEARTFLDAIIDGHATPAQAGAFLLLERYKGETPDELLGLIDSVRARATTQLLRPNVDGLLDIGSPYDGRLRTIMVSPAASIVAAACGVPVLMHGERNVGPKHGLTVADVLDALGVPTDLPHEAVARSLEQIGIGYLRQERFAPDMARLAGLRDELALRTPINMVEKVYDPAGAPYHLIGLTHLPYLDKLGDALARLGFRKTALVQGMEGNEDLPTNRGVRVIEFEGESKREYRLDAADFGLTPATAEETAPGEVDGRPAAGRGVQLTAQVLAGEAPDSLRDLVLFNAGFRVYLAGRATDIAAGIERAREAVASGAAAALVDRWRATSVG